MNPRLNELSGRAQLLVYASVSIALCAAAWEFLLAPARANLISIQHRAATLQADVSGKRAMAVKLPSLERNIQALEESLHEATAILPGEKDSQDLLRELHEVAGDASLELSSFTPKPVVARTQYSEWPIELGLDGTYHDLGRFLDRVAKMPRLMSVTDLHIRASARPESHATITASCTARAFVFQKEWVNSEAPVQSAHASSMEDLP